MLSKFEVDAIASILASEGIRVSLENLCVERREKIRVGGYTYFLHETEGNGGNEHAIGSKVFCESSEVENGIGVLLYLNGMEIVMLEYFTHSGEPFPERDFDYQFSVMEIT